MSRLPVLTAAVAVAAAGASFSRAVEPSAVPAAVLAGTALGLLLGLLVRGPLAVVAAAVGAAVLGSVAGAALAGAAAGAPAAGLRALRSGWTDVLATAPPVPADEARLPVVVVTVAVGAVAAVALARARRPALALLPAVAVLLVGLALGAGAPGGAAAAAPLAAMGAVHLVLVAPRARRPPAVAVGVVAVLAGALLGPQLTIGPEADPRALVDPPVETVAAPAPLAVLPARLSSPDTRLFTAAVDAAWLASPRNWRQVVLEDFDGVTWSARAEPVRIGTRVPGDRPPGPLSRSTVVVERLEGPWVPTTGDPVSVGRGDLAAVPGTSVLLDPDGVHDRYTVDSVLPQPDAAALDRAALPALQGSDRSLAVPPCLPDDLRTFAADAVAGVSGPGRQAVALEQAFAAMTASNDVDPGHSCGRFPALLEDRRGTSEQFAPAYVLAARSIGLPARLAVGFRPGRIAGGTTTVLSGDVLAWPEVHFAGLGWVPFDPTPRELSEEGARQELPALTEIRRQVAGEPAPLEGEPPPPARVAPPVEEPSTPWLLLTVTAAGLAAAGLAVRPLRRAVRRRRRRGAEPRAAVLGAWLETLDVLGADRARTPAQVLDGADVPAPASRPLSVVGGLADLAAYGPDAPGPEQVEAAWAAHARVRREVRRGRRRRRGPQPGAPPRTHTGST